MLDAFLVRDGATGRVVSPTMEPDLSPDSLDTSAPFSMLLVFLVSEGRPLEAVEERLDKDLDRDEEVAGSSSAMGKVGARLRDG